MPVIDRAYFTMSLFLVASTGLWASSASAHSLPSPSLSLVEHTLLTTAKSDFNGHDHAFDAATQWDRERLRASNDELRAPHLACAKYGHGREAMFRLQTLLSPEAVRPASHSSTHGACFIATASHTQAAAMSTNPAEFELDSFGPFPSALKIAPGLLDHGQCCDSDGVGDGGSLRLATTHGVSMRMDNVRGLFLELSPGTLPAHAAEADAFMNDLLEDLTSESIDLHASNFWSDPALLEGEHLAIPEGALRGREWSRAAAVVHGLSAAAKTTPGDVCSWDRVAFHHASDDTVLISGLDALLHSGRGVGGQGEEATELHMACLMGLVSFFASRPEVLRVAPWHSKRLLNAAARANIQSATVTSTPLTDAGLDGEGQVVQVVDSGVNETSCYFAHGDGKGVQHGHYFEEIGSSNSRFSSSSQSFSRFKSIFEGGDFTFDSDRRKVIQYINLVKADDEDGDSGSGITTSEGKFFPFVEEEEFGQDDNVGHGSHTAGTIAGATLNTPAEPVTCGDDQVLGCAGGCLSYNFNAEAEGNTDGTLDLLCPSFGCDGGEDEQCLGDDVSETLTDNGGIAQGAKLAIFDMFYGDYSYADLAGNGLWEACLDAGCKVHSNSYGVDSRCILSAIDLMYDDFMYKNPENLLIFAAGNEGGYTDRTVCTANSPGIAKNVLAIGASSSGDTRLTTTGSDGKPADGDNGYADIDTMASFSSYGPTEDRRIKPEVVAPGDKIYSASGDGLDVDSCRLAAFDGTSMACAVAAGSAAMVRQYFADSSFYADDVKERGFCDNKFLCESFSPASATVKAMLINSANLMGGTSEPGKFRGFGRIHLEAGMPLSGEGDMALFVADAGETEIAEESVDIYLFDVNAEAGLDLRATLSWIDPAASTISVVQLIHDLDLSVIAPNGTRFTMWADHPEDIYNVNERVIVDSNAIPVSGTWEVHVKSKTLTTDTQSYSLVVTGAISPGTREIMSASSGHGTELGHTTRVEGEGEGEADDEEEEEDDEDDEDDEVEVAGSTGAAASTVAVSAPVSLVALLFATAAMVAMVGVA